MFHAQWKAVVINVANGSFSVDDYWSPGVTRTISLTGTKDFIVTLTISNHSNCVFWYGSAKYHQNGTYTLNYSAGTYSVDIGANIASGCANGSVSYSITMEYK